MYKTVIDDYLLAKTSFIAALLWRVHLFGEGI